MTTYVERLVEEFKELTAKIVKLECFIYADSTFKSLEEDQRTLLKKQLMYMHGYHDVLAKRLELANK